MGRLSDLPEDLLLHIISFLPTKFAAQTSLLSRRFHRLWESSPGLDLDLGSYSLYCTLWTPSHFIPLANLTILNRNPASPLVRLRLSLRRLQTFVTGMNEIPRMNLYIASLLSKAGSFGLRHLSVQLNCSKWISQTALPSILSICSLESLSLEFVFIHPLDPSTPINLKHLKTLRIIHPAGSPNDFINRVIPQLDNLEDLYILASDTDFPHLKSKTLKKLKLDIPPINLRISTPSLELFELEAIMSFASNQWEWEMPVLRKAAIQLKYIDEKDTEVVFKMLNAIANVQELHIDITESHDQTGTFNALLLRGVEPPTFVNLKHFNLEISFHEYNIEDLVTLLEYTPALESLRLVHKPPCRARKDKKKKLWRSRLPRNDEGNCRHAYFEDLHIPGMKEKVLEELTKKQSSKRFKT